MIDTIGTLSANLPAASNERVETRAIDRTGVNRPASADATSGIAFADTLSASHRAAPSADPGSIREAKALVQLEASLLQTFVEAMMPKDTEAYGSGFAGEAWKSMTAENLATTLAESGSFGLAETLSRSFGTHRGDGNR